MSSYTRDNVSRTLFPIYNQIPVTHPASFSPTLMRYSALSPSLIPEKPLEK